jgi:hypothetical protein
MAELKIIIPEELKRQMDALNLDWSSLMRKLLKREVDELSELKSIVSQSELSEQDALEMSKKVNKALAKRFKETAMR